MNSTAEPEPATNFKNIKNKKSNKNTSFFERVSALLLRCLLYTSPSPRD